MKSNYNIEAEGSELVLRNSAGDHVIIPKKYRQEVKDMIREGCFGCIDNIVSTLPVASDYAEDGTLLPLVELSKKPKAKAPEMNVPGKLEMKLPVAKKIELDTPPVGKMVNVGTPQRPRQEFRGNLTKAMDRLLDAELGSPANIAEQEAQIAESNRQMRAQLEAERKKDWPYITDTRFKNKVPHPVTGGELDPNRDLFSGKYDPLFIQETAQAAADMEADPYLAIALGIQESKGGDIDSNTGHIFADEVFEMAKSKYGENGYTQNQLLSTGLKWAMDNYKKTYERLGISYPPEEETARMLQFYNGLGTINDETEKEYHENTGRSSKFLYGVDVSKNPIDTKQNPVYGKTVVSIAEVLRNDPDVIRLVNEAISKAPKK